MREKTKDFLCLSCMSVILLSVFNTTIKVLADEVKSEPQEEVINTVVVDNKFGMLAMTEMGLQYAENISIDSSLFTAEQINVNKILYAQTAAIINKEHMDFCFTDYNSNIFQSFREHFTPLTALSFSLVEWGGHSNLNYAFTPSIATKDLGISGVDFNYFNPYEVNSSYYAVNNISFDDGKYKGPLQIEETYFEAEQDSSIYKCGGVPVDYYSWTDEVQWYFHNKCESFGHAWNQDYQFQNNYEVLAHLSVMHNSGADYMSNVNAMHSENWWPWNDSQAVYNYVSAISTGNNLQIILDNADEFVREKKEQIRLNPDSDFGTLYCSLQKAREEMVSKMSINTADYVQEQWKANMALSASLSGDAKHNWEKLLYPVQSIWTYRVLEQLYGLN